MKQNTIIMKWNHSDFGHDKKKLTFAHKKLFNIHISWTIYSIIMPGTVSLYYLRFDYWRMFYTQKTQKIETGIKQIFTKQNIQSRHKVKELYK